jgi:conjugal transfer pilus assembly protein TrbC
MRNARCVLLILGALCVCTARSESEMVGKALREAEEALNLLRGVEGAQSTEGVTQSMDTAAKGRNLNEMAQSADALNKASNDLKGVVITDQLANINSKKTQADISRLTKQFTALPMLEKDRGDRPVLLIFVSQSIPFETLKQLAVEADLAGTPLVFRGFVDNSMRSTLIYFKKLINSAQQADAIDSPPKSSLSLMIDPLLFSRYNVTQVPSFTVIREGQRCIGPTAQCKGDVPEHFTVSGDVSLSYAVESLQRLAPLFGDELTPVSQKLQVRF